MQVDFIKGRGCFSTPSFLAIRHYSASCVYKLLDWFNYEFKIVILVWKLMFLARP